MNVNSAYRLGLQTANILVLTLPRSVFTWLKTIKSWPEEWEEETNGLRGKLGKLEYSVVTEHPYLHEVHFSLPVGQDDLVAPLATLVKKLNQCPAEFRSVQANDLDISITHQGFCLGGELSPKFFSWALNTLAETSKESRLIRTASHHCWQTCTHFDQIIKECDVELPDKPKRDGFDCHTFDGRTLLLGRSGGNIGASAQKEEEKFPIGHHNPGGSSMLWLLLYQLAFMQMYFWEFNQEEKPA